MVRATDDEILDAMQRYGGGFVVALARLFQRADPVNQVIVREAFRHYWEEYGEIVERRRAPHCPRCGSYAWTYHGGAQVCADCGR
jgi:ribosomal protein S27AE